MSAVENASYEVLRASYFEVSVIKVQVVTERPHLSAIGNSSIFHWMSSPSWAAIAWTGAHVRQLVVWYRAAVDSRDISAEFSKRKDMPRTPLPPTTFSQQFFPSPSFFYWSGNTTALCLDSLPAPRCRELPSTWYTEFQGVLRIQAKVNN